MRLSHAARRAIAMMMTFAFIAAACGGGGEEAAAPGGEDADPGFSLPVPDASAAEVGNPEPQAIPTADPSLFETPTPDASNVEPTDPWEVSVLISKPGTSFVPVFEEPNGSSVQLYDVNPINGTQLEYPLVNPTYFGNDLALLVVEKHESGDWAKVRVPVRPNNKLMWVQTAFFEETTHNFHINIDLSDLHLQVWEGDELIVENKVVLGQPERPTPPVRTYIDEKIPQPDGTGAYGTWILSLGAFSEDLSDFAGGLPKLAIHGTNEPERMGEYASSGCIRLPNEIINLIAETVPVGTVVEIYP